MEARPFLISILTKTLAGRLQDRADLEKIIQHYGRRLDLVYINRWLADFGLPPIVL